MKKFLLLLFTALLLTACDESGNGNASHYDKPTYDMNGVRVIKPIKQYRLGGSPSVRRYLLFYVFDGTLWYEYYCGGDVGEMHPYKKVYGDIEKIDFDAMVTEIASDTTKTDNNGEEKTSTDN